MKPHTHITSALLLIGALCYAPLTFAQAWEDLSSDSQQVLRPLRINWEELSTDAEQRNSRTEEQMNDEVVGR